MAVKTEKSRQASVPSGPGRRVEERQVLALNTLSKLAKQFSNRPDFAQLNELLVLTVSGQFSVPNICALIRQPGTQTQVPLLFATGKFRSDKLLLTRELTPAYRDYFLENNCPVDVSRLCQDSSVADLGFVLAESGVKLVAPLVNNDNLIGIIGLGEKVTREPFDDDDIELLSTLVNSIMPFLASSFLFIEIAALNVWYLSILDSVGQGVFVFDSLKRLKKVNATGFKMLKSFKPHLVHAASLDKLPVEAVFPENVFSGWVGRLRSALEGTSRRKLLENMTAASGDMKRIYNVHVSNVDGSSVLETDLIITIDDITDQKESERRLFELQKLADRGVMASTISHELNNFLGLILGGVELTQLAIEKSDLVKVEENLGRIKQSVAKMERFTSGLMDYTKLRTTKKTENLNRVLGDVLAHVTAHENFVGIRVLSELDAAIPDFDFDADQIAQLVLNLLNNAADAIKECNRPKGEIVVRSALGKDRVVLSVSDNGAGMAPEVKAKLFRRHITTKEKGHGYGLVTCGKIIENHGAEVMVDSTAGKGTSFSISFTLSGNSD